MVTKINAREVCGRIMVEIGSTRSYLTREEACLLADLLSNITGTSDDREAVEATTI